MYLDDEENAENSGEEDEDVVEVVQEEASGAATANSQVTKVPSSGTAAKRRQSTLQFKPATASKEGNQPFNSSLQQQARARQSQMRIRSQLLLCLEGLLKRLLMKGIQGGSKRPSKTA